jgi:CubicO group peptidase (beta-lactamase class C family)
MKLRAIVASSLLFLCSCALTCQQQPPEELKPVIDQLDKLATELVKDPSEASFTIGLVQKSGLVWSKSYGYADVESKRPANADSVYRIGSITKQFTALMLLQLVHDGKVHLSDPVEKYFPEIHQVQGEYKNAPPITLVQLATHTAGLDREPANMETYVKGPVSDWEKILISALPHTKYLYEPGTRFSYSNIGYAILGATLSRAAKQPYTEYVKQRILLPLGMTHSDFELTPALEPHMTTGYDRDENNKIHPETAAQEHKAGRGYKVPNGALYTTVGDMAKFVAFELHGGPESVLPNKELEENARRLVASNPGLQFGYGIGFLIQRKEDRELIGHSGAVAGYLAAAYYRPDANTGIIVLHNEIEPSIGKLVDLFWDKLEMKAPGAKGGAPQK